MKSVMFVVISALLTSFAQGNEVFLYGNPLLALIAHIPLYWALKQRKKARGSGALGAIFGLVMTLTQFSWLSNFGDYSLWTIGGVALAYTFFHAALFQWLWKGVHLGDRVGPWVFAALYTIFEFIRSNGYLAFPWGLGAYPFHEVLPLIQVAEWQGVYPISFVVFLWNAGLAQWLSERKIADPAAPIAVVFAGLMIVYGIVRLPQIPAMYEDEVDVLLIQHNADSWKERGTSVVERLQEQTLRALDRSDAPDALVWSETAINFDPDYNGSFERLPRALPMESFVRRLPVPLLAGAPRFDPEDPGSLRNSAVILDWGGVADEYGKIKLVPFAEHNPVLDFEPLREFLANTVGLPGSGWAFGKGFVPLELKLFDGRTVMVGTPICFEDSFADAGRYLALAGAEIFINLTNNAWSRTKSAQTQHLISARFRSVETRRSLVRATNGGVTTVFAPTGEQGPTAPMFQATELRIQAPLVPGDSVTAYMILGDLFPYLAAVLGLMALINSYMRPNRKLYL